MDLLGDLLDGPRAHGAFVLRMVMDPPWSVRIADEAPLTLMAVTGGRCWWRPDDAEPVLLEAGDVALVRGPAPYVVSDEVDDEPRILIGIGQECSDLDGRLVDQSMALGVRTWGNSRSGATSVLVGTWLVESEVSRPLLEALPRLVVRRVGEWDDVMVDLVVRETGREGPGRASVLDRMLDLLLVGVVRPWLAEHDGPTAGVALADPVVGHVLRLLHEAPEQAWTLVSLARSAGTSRAVLARRFSALVGEPPIGYLTPVAARPGRRPAGRPEHGLEQVAHEVGYGSSFALSTAFKRRYGASTAELACGASVSPVSVVRVSDAGSDVMIRARGLRKSFPQKDGDPFEAVKGIDVEVRRGEAFGFLGPNGAGKSSTMRMIAAVSPVSEGELRILGLDPAVDGSQIRGRIGVCPQEDSLDTELTVYENLFVYGRYFGIPRAEVRRRATELLDFVQLGERAGAKVEDLSGGMKRRLTIARSMINEPEMVLLDEPTTGLDPQARHVLWDRLFRLKQQGVTLVITTHYMDEAEQLCDRLVVMDKGLIVAEGSPAELIRAHSTREVAELRFAIGESEMSAVRVRAAVGGLAERVEVLPDRLLLYSQDGEAAIAKVHAEGLAPVATLVRRSSLEDVFLRLTGRTLVD